MAIPTAVNGQITDAVTQANSSQPLAPTKGVSHELLGDIIRALGTASQKGINNQQLAWALQQAAATVGISLLYPKASEEEQTTPEHVIAYLKKLIDQHRD